MKYEVHFDASLKKKMAFYGGTVSISGKRAETVKRYLENKNFVRLLRYLRRVVKEEIKVSEWVVLADGRKDYLRLEELKKIRPYALFECRAVDVERVDKDGNVRGITSYSVKIPLLSFE
jgi:hypothetical protein